MTSNESYPYVALSAQTTGIHPSTGRILTIDAVTFDDGGRVGEEFHAVINPGCDPGPRHTHGLSTHEVAQAPRFTRFLKSLDKLLDDRVLVTFDTPTTWGFIVSEARRAMSAAARAWATSRTPPRSWTCWPRRVGKAWCPRTCASGPSRT